MTEITSASKSFPKVYKKNKNWVSYLLLLTISNFAMWGLAIFYIKSAVPSYESNFSLSLPGTVSYTNVNLPERGTAYSQPVSPYENSLQDPRENYKLIMESSIVKKTAAEKMQMSVEEFGEPRIKILDKTTAINLEFKSDIPKKAEAKSWAFLQAFQERLNTLRYKESTKLENQVEKSLKESQQKLELAQRRFFEYRNSSGFVTDTQLEDLASNLEQLRNKRNEAAVKKQQSSTRLNELSSSFKISTPEATNTFILQSDQIFRQHLKNYSEATSNLVLLESKFLSDHPSVLDAQKKQELAKAALLARSQSLLGYPIDQQTLNKLSGDGIQQEFVEGIVTAGVDQQESKATIQELSNQITQLQTRLQTMAKHKSTLEALKREMQIAEAVYSSNLASLDVNKSNFYGSYPEIQLLTEPNLPEEASSPNEKFVFLGTGLASLFSIAAIFTIYLRSNLLKFAKEKKSPRG
ncbi:MAG: hypothetical protein WBA07_19840 [Rivularia sp. (in: cyanobacteria)]